MNASGAVGVHRAVSREQYIVVASCFHLISSPLASLDVGPDNWRNSAQVMLLSPAPYSTSNGDHVKAAD